MNRRGFLNGLVATAGLGLAGLVAGEKIHEELLKRHPPSFDEVYEQTIDFVKKYNRVESGKGGFFSYKISEHRLSEMLKQNGIDPRDNDQLINFYTKNGKVFLGTNRRVNEKKIFEYFVGDIKDSWKESFMYDNQTLVYNVVLFEQSAPTLLNEKGYSDASAFWNKKTKTAFINMTQMEKNAESLYRQGMKLGNKRDNFYNAMVLEFYERLMKKAMLNDSTLFANDPFLAFKEEFIKFGVPNAIVHERMHHYYPQTGMEEYMPFIAEITSNLELNSYTFIIADETSFPKLYKAFRALGYDKKKLIKLPSEERTKIAEKIIGD